MTTGQAPRKSSVAYQHGHRQIAHLSQNRAVCPNGLEDTIVVTLFCGL